MQIHLYSDLAVAASATTIAPILDTSMRPREDLATSCVGARCTRHSGRMPRPLVRKFPALQTSALLAATRPPRPSDCMTYDAISAESGASSSLPVASAS